MNGAQKCCRGISDTVDSDSLSHIVKNNHPKSKSLALRFAARGIELLKIHTLLRRMGSECTATRAKVVHAHTGVHVRCW